MWIYNVYVNTLLLTAHSLNTSYQKFNVMRLFFKWDNNRTYITRLWGLDEMIHAKYLAHNTCSVSAGIHRSAIDYPVDRWPGSLGLGKHGSGLRYKLEGTSLLWKGWFLNRKFGPHVERMERHVRERSGGILRINLGTVAEFLWNLMSSLPRGGWPRIFLKSLSPSDFCDYLDDRQN